MSEPVEHRIEAAARSQMRGEIARADGQEVLFVGSLSSEGRVVSVDVVARGAPGSVAVPVELCERGDLVLHNHPNGVLRPSDADVSVAARLAESGIGSAIVDNDLTMIYVLVEPVPVYAIEQIDTDEVVAALDDGGAFQHALAGFIPRDAQLEMARQVAAAFNNSALLAVEAGTGVGKSFGYLVPALAWAARNQERVVIATATIALQQQIVAKDLPVAQRALGTELPVALVKGRGHYLCRRKLEDERAEAELFDDSEQLGELFEWASSTESGNRSDLPTYVADELWNRVSSDSDGCSAARCPNRERCFVLRARRQAAAARILVANHHLVFSDLAIRQAGAGWDGTAILPPSRRLVFDEAHNMERSATSFFSQVVSRAAIVRSLRRLLRTRGRHRFGLLDRLAGLGAASEALVGIERALTSVERATEDLNSATVALLADEPSFRLTRESAQRLTAATATEMDNCHGALTRLADSLADIARATPDERREDQTFYELMSLVRRFESYASTLDRFRHGFEADDPVCWIERRRGRDGLVWVRWYVTPLDLRSLLREAVFEPHETVVMTSATLAVGGSFDYWGSRLGVSTLHDRFDAMVLPSPFDFARRVLLAVAADAPPPNAPGFVEYLERFLHELVTASDGGALLLFTSYGQLNEVWDRTAARIEASGYRCLRQGQDDRGRLLESFRADRTSVLFATDSFWEGVDAPGDTLRLVVVCRLPFRVPTDPIQVARAELIERGGGNAFAELSLPQATIRLKQGFGRLMRRVDDFGAVVVADSRMATRSYGRLMVESLPSPRVFAGRGDEIVEEVGTFLAAFRDAAAIPTEQPSSGREE